MKQYEKRTKENVKVILRFSFIEKLKILFSRNTCVYVDLSNDMKLIGNTIYSESRIINNVCFHTTEAARDLYYSVESI